MPSLLVGLSALTFRRFKPVTMPKKSPQVFFDLAEANDYDKLNKTAINGELVVKNLSQNI